MHNFRLTSDNGFCFKKTDGWIQGDEKQFPPPDHSKTKDQGKYVCR